ncbi:MAG: hypothetical protein ABIA78_00675 [archaeon]
MLQILPLLLNFAVIVFIGIKSLNSECFNAGDINISITALIFAVIVEMVLIKRRW